MAHPMVADPWKPEASFESLGMVLDPFSTVFRTVGPALLTPSKTRLGLSVTHVEKTILVRDCLEMTIFWMDLNLIFD